MILKAAMFAPSARNTQAWQFVVINDHEKLKALSQIHPYGKMLKSAALAILVCGDMKKDKTLSYLIQNCSAATQNILLAANELSIGSVWLGIQPREDRIRNMMKFFNLPQHIVPISLISLGYPKEEPKQVNRFDASCIHYNGWTY